MTATTKPVSVILGDVIAAIESEGIVERFPVSADAVREAQRLVAELIAADVEYLKQPQQKCGCGVFLHPQRQEDKTTGCQLDDAGGGAPSGIRDEQPDGGLAAPTNEPQREDLSALIAQARREYRDSDAAGDVLDWLEEQIGEQPQRQGDAVDQWKCRSCGCEHGIAGEPSWTHGKEHEAEANWRCDRCDHEQPIKLWETKPASAAVAWSDVTDTQPPLGRMGPYLILGLGDQGQDMICIAQGRGSNGTLYEQMTSKAISFKATKFASVEDVMAMLAAAPAKPASAAVAFEVGQRVVWTSAVSGKHPGRVVRITTGHTAYFVSLDDGTYVEDADASELAAAPDRSPVLGCNCGAIAKGDADQTRHSIDCAIYADHSQNGGEP